MAPLFKCEHRIFKLWEYHVSHAQLLIRSPKSPATLRRPEFRTNIDLVFRGVEYMATPRILDGLEVVAATSDELDTWSLLVEKNVELSHATVMLSGGHRFVVVSENLAIVENDWDIFESPFEFRSQFRAPGS